ncbi:hypothetical protein GCM10022252_43450 [Streptosporangium oxazolinicum]|uniref:Uncharacterized protein n=1 Tax=Streptosporangium oxazolinicum TaxID=909287 RepID=A0ABP8B2D4_9ACTN
MVLSAYGAREDVEPVTALAMRPGEPGAPPDEGFAEPPLDAISRERRPAPA